MYYSTKYKSPIGLLTIVSDEKNLVGLWIKDQKYYGDTINTKTIENNNLLILNETKQWLDRYFDGQQPTISELPLAPIGGEFRKAIWDILCEIPYGNTITYGEIAKKIAIKNNIKSMSSQAVGGAISHNPISIIIPCHRVIGGNGSLTGFAGGIDKKLKLLKLEGIDTSKFKIPTKSTLQ